MATDPDHTTPMTSIVAYWNDDAESWWITDGEADEAEGRADMFHALVAVEAREAQKAAYETWCGATEHLVNLMGLSVDEARLERPCAEWSGSTVPPRPYVTVKALIGDNGYPMHFGGHDTIAEAEAMIASLPDVVYVLAWGKPTEIRRDDLVIDAGEHAGYTTDCHRCGWAKDDHHTATEASS